MDETQNEEDIVASGKVREWYKAVSSTSICTLGNLEYKEGLDGRSRMMGDYHVRICEGLRGKFPRATRRFVLKELAQNKPHYGGPVMRDVTRRGQLDRAVVSVA